MFDDLARESVGGGSIDWAASRDAASIRAASTAGREWQTEAAIPDMGAAIAEALASLVRIGLLSKELTEVTAVGHRVVHGGTQFPDAVRIDPSVKRVIAELRELAPLHNPPALESITAAQERLPGVPHMAAFDTTFFARLPARAYLYPTPYEWFERWGIRRFGFHGISHEYCAGRAGEMLNNPGAKIIVCHLGHGCSATAIRDGAAVSTTMGFTPLEGLMMGTRSGSIDPGILVHVQGRHGLSAQEVDEALNRKSGLLGVSGVSSDFRQVDTAAEEGNPRAQLALEMYADRIRATIGALATTIGGVDALVFTAGVGENNARLRAVVCVGLEHLGLVLDTAKNLACQPDCDVASDDFRGRILVIHTREALMIARLVRSHTRRTAP